MRKILNKKCLASLIFTAIIAGVINSFNYAFADPIVELAAPRITPRIIQDSGATVQPTSNAGAKETQKAKAKKIASKKHKKHAHKKAVIKINYAKVSKLIEYGHYDEADKILTNAILKNPKDLKAQTLSAVSNAKQGNLDVAQQEINRLIKIYPQSADLHYAQGIVYYQRTASSNMIYRNNAQKYVNNALTEFTKAIELDKADSRAYNAAGVISLNEDNPKNARDYFNKAILADKTYALAIDNLGTMDFLSGKLNDAEKKFKNALVYNSQSPTAMYHLAQVYFQKQDYAKTLIYLNNANSLNSTSPAIYNLFGKTYAAQGNQAAAINSFKKSLELKPEFTMSYLDLADIYEQRGDYEFAIEQLKTALSLEPNYNEAKLKIADLSMQSGNYSQAISAYGEIVGLDGCNDRAVKGLASAYYAQAQIAANKSQIGSNKELFKALEYINKAIKASPQDIELHLAKLKLSKLTNQPEQSKTELNSIINSPANNLVSLVIKGEAYIAMNDYASAQKAFENAAKQSKTADDDLYLCEIFTYHREYNLAENIIQKMLKANPKNQQALCNFDYIQKCKKYAQNYFNSAKYFLKTKNSALAVEYLNRTIAVDPNNSSAHLYLGQIYEKQKDYMRAVAQYKVYLSLEPYASGAKKISRKIKILENRL